MGGVTRWHRDRFVRPEDHAASSRAIQARICACGRFPWSFLFSYMRYRRDVALRPPCRRCRDVVAVAAEPFLHRRRVGPAHYQVRRRSVSWRSWGRSWHACRARHARRGAVEAQLLGVPCVALMKRSPAGRGRGIQRKVREQGPRGPPERYLQSHRPDGAGRRAAIVGCMLSQVVDSHRIPAAGGAPASSGVLKRLSRLLQWCFLRVEGLFNLAFGDKLNPLYHIGRSRTT